MRRLQAFLTALPFSLIPLHARKVSVSNVDALTNAVSAAKAGDTLLLAPGTYTVSGPLQVDGKSNLTFLSSSGDPENTVLKGQGWGSMDETDDILRIGSSTNIFVENLGFQDCHSYGIKLEAEKNPVGIHIRGCHFRDIGMRQIKGTMVQGTKATGGEIVGCHFENTKVPGADWLENGNYIAAIDMMALDGWEISDNTFLNVKGLSGEGRAAIFIWVGSQNVTVERNVIVGCDRGIAFGNPSPSSNGAAFHVHNSICRNNFIVAGPDAGIELAWVDSVKILHNTIWRDDASGRGIRSIQNVTHTVIGNNLLRGQVILSGGETTRNNYSGTLTGYFVNVTTGNLHLTAQATQAVDQGTGYPDAPMDFDGDTRPTGTGVDLGADELGNTNPILRKPKRQGRFSEVNPTHYANAAGRHLARTSIWPRSFYAIPALRY